MMKAFLLPFDKVAVAASELETKWDYRVATGVALDHIADILKVKRLGADDEELVRRIRAAIAVNFCTGDIESVINALKILFNSDKVRVLNHGQGLFTAEVKTAETWGEQYLDKIPAAGCRIGYFVPYDDFTFTLDDEELGLDQGELA